MLCAGQGHVADLQIKAAVKTGKVKYQVES